MELFLTPGRVKSFQGLPGPGGYKIYLTNRDGTSWVEFGGGGAKGNPHGLARQKPRGYASELDAWDFVRDEIATRAVIADPLAFHRLYTYAHDAEFYCDRSIPVSHGSAPALEPTVPQKCYKLIGPDGRQHMSALKGTLGGYNRPGNERLYGRLDCKNALRWIAKGHYIPYRVFFADEATAIAAGYRPCSRCMKPEFAAWKARRA